jgi:hypothetical protein
MVNFGENFLKNCSSTVDTDGYAEFCRAGAFVSGFTLQKIPREGRSQAIQKCFQEINACFSETTRRKYRLLVEKFFVDADAALEGNQVDPEGTVRARMKRAAQALENQQSKRQCVPSQNQNEMVSQKKSDVQAPILHRPKGAKDRHSPSKKNENIQLAPVPHREKRSFASITGGEQSSSSVEKKEPEKPRPPRGGVGFGVSMAELKQVNLRTTQKPGEKASEKQGREPKAKRVKPNPVPQKTSPSVEKKAGVQEEVKHQSAQKPEEKAPETSKTTPPAGKEESTSGPCVIL